MLLLLVLLLPLQPPPWDLSILASQNYFDAALLWNTQFKKASRRKTVDPNKRLPSWSWMGWDNEISVYFKVHPAVAARKKPSIYKGSEGRQTLIHWKKFVPLVKWYSLSASTSQKRKITSHMEKYGHVDIAAKLPPPEGWSRHVDIVASIPQPDGTEKQCKFTWYTNADVPDVIFMYPIPLKHEYDQLASAPQATSHLICCRAQRGWAFVGDVQFALYDEKGTRIGLLDDGIAWGPAMGFGVKYELVAISLANHAEESWGNIDPGANYDE